MKHLTKHILIALALLGKLYCAPVGICLHAYSPEAPADKIECFEFARVENVANGYRFFIEPHGSMIVTKYRYRGTIPYKPHLVPGHPDFEDLLKLYEGTARATPMTRRYLNPRILAMREQKEGHLAERQHLDSLPKITIDGSVYLAPKFSKFDSGKLVLSHKDGIVKLSLDKVSDADLSLLAKLDPKAADIEIMRISGKRLWNPRYKGLEAGNVQIEHEGGTTAFDLDTLQKSDFDTVIKIDRSFGNVRFATVDGKKLWNPSLLDLSSTTLRIKHEKGILPMDMDQLSESDRKTIMSWSDGTWKVGKPGLYQAMPEAGSYKEIILENGKFYTDVKLVDLEGESVVLNTSKSKLELPIKQVASLPGLSQADTERIEGWIATIINDRLDRARPENSTEQISFNKADILRVTDVRVRILQVLDEGVLASEFVGKLHKGTKKVKTTRTIQAEHPVTGAIVSKVIHTSVDDVDVTEDVRDDLCYIVGNTSNLTDGEIVTADSMRLEGRYQYTDVRGAKRTVRKYHVD